MDVVIVDIWIQPFGSYLSSSTSALLITTLVGLLGLGIGLTFALLDHRIDRNFLLQLAQGLGATLNRLRIEGSYRDRRYTLVLGRQSRSSLAVLRLMVHAGISEELIVRRASVTERFAQEMKLVNLARTGDARFDESFFVIAQDGAPARCMLDAPARLAAVRQLFGGGVTRLDYSAEAQAVVAEWTPFQGVGEWSATQVRAALDHLVEVAAPLPMQAIKSAVTTPRQEVNGFLPVFAMVLVLFAFGTMLAIWADDLYTPTDRVDLFVYSLRISVLALLLFAYITYRALRRNLEGYRYWVALVVLGIPTIPIAGYAATLYINGAHDNLPVEPALYRVIEKNKRPRNGSFSYVVHTAPPVMPEMSKEFEIPSSLYSQIDSSVNYLTVVVHPGALGFTWINMRKDVRLATTAQ